MKDEAASSSNTGGKDHAQHEGSGVGHVAHELSHAAGVLENAAHAIGQHLPGVVGVVEKAGHVVSTTLDDNKSSNRTENLVCGAVQGAAELGAEVAVAAGVTAAVAAAGPVATGAAVGAGMGVAGTAALQAGIGTAIGAAAQSFVDNVTRPVGELANSGCHAAFAWARGTSNSAASAQQTEARSNWYGTCSLDNGMNPFQTYAVWVPPRGSMSHIGDEPRSGIYSMMESRAEIRRVAERAIQSQMMSITPSMLGAWCDAQLSLGAGYSMSYSEFSEAVRSSSLTGTYNNFNPNSNLREVVRFFRDVGGVASDVSVIKDLVDSDAHDADEYFICFPKSNSHGLHRQIAREIESAYFTHKTTPFFSLEFNNKGFMFPVIHPAFKDTLTGEIIALLDYWMKGYLNGGVFDEKFIETWHKTANCDEDELRKHLVDLKEYCKQNCPDVGYVSLRELMSKYGQVELTASKDYAQPFQTSFRIIAFQERVEREGNVLRPKPSFRIEYSVDLMPDYKKFLDNYFREHGEYPEDYQRIRYCYEQYAQEIAEKMPKLPMCKNFFELLGVANFYCYFYATLKEMGKRPDLKEEPSVHHYQVPKSFPPIPVKYFKTENFKLSFDEIIAKLKETLGEAKLNEMLLPIFSMNILHRTPHNLQAVINAAVVSLIKERLPEATINDDEVEKLQKSTVKIIAILCFQAKRAAHQFEEMLESYLGKGIFNKFSKLSYMERLQAIKTEVDSKLQGLASRWEADNGLAIREIYQNSPKELHEKIKEAVQKADESIEEERSEIKKRLEYFDSAEMKEQESQLAEAIKAQTASMQEAEDYIAKLITHRDSQVALVPANLRELNKANIEAFCEPINEDIANTREVVAKMKERIAELTKMQSDAQASIQKDKATLWAALSDASLKEGKDKAYNHIAQHVLTMLRESNSRTLDKIISVAREFTGSFGILGSDRFPDVSDKYTYGVMGFSSEDTVQKSGHNLKVVGGCGMSLPSLSTEPMANANVFVEEVAKACAQLEREESRDIATSSGEYTVFRFPIKDAPVFTNANTTSAAQDLLSKLIDEKVNVADIKGAELTKKIDKSNATLAHYAVKLCSGRRFREIVAHHGASILKLEAKFALLPIHFAAQSGNLEVVEAIVSSAPELLDAATDNAMTPLMFAAQHGHTQVVKKLIALGANANHKMPNSLTPVYVAIQNQYSECALAIIADSAILKVNEPVDSSHTEGIGMTALHLACENDMTEVAIALIAKGGKGDMKRKSDGLTPLHIAAMLGNSEVVKSIIASQVPSELSTESGNTALHFAAMENQLSVVEHLLSVNASINLLNNDLLSPLMLAIKFGAADIALKLAESAELDLKGADEKVASVMALEYGLPQVADLLISRGEKVVHKDNSGFDYIYYLIRHGQYVRLENLITEMDGSYISSLSYHGQNLLEVAMHYNQVDIVYLLLERGLRLPQKHEVKLAEFYARVDEIASLKEIKEASLQSNIESLSVIAAQNGSVQCLSFLLERLEPITVVKLSLLAKVIASGKVDAIKKVVSKCPDLLQPLDKDGNNALHLAVRHGLREVVELLIEAGVSPLKENNKGQSAFKLAVIQGDSYLLKRLFKLTKPGQRPSEIVIKDIKPTKKVMELLNKYNVKLTSVLNDSDHGQVEQEVAAASSASIAPDYNAFARFMMLVQFNAYDAATSLMHESPALLEVFKIADGGKKLRKLFGELEDTSVLASKTNLGGDEEIEVESPESLLVALKAEGIDLRKYQGFQNVLWAVLTARDDNTACFRFGLIVKHFKESLPILLQDKLDAKNNFSQLALRFSKPKLFQMISEYASAIASDSEDSVLISGLHEAITANNYVLVEALLKSHDINALNDKQQSPLMLAALMGNKKILSLLLEKGADIELCDNHGRNALHYAVQSQDDEAGLMLIPIYRDCNKPDRHGVSPLSIAAAGGRLAIVRNICEAGYFIDDVDTIGQNPLHDAASSGKDNVVEFLVNYGFDIDKPESPTTKAKLAASNNRTPLHLAAMRGHLQTLKKLIELGANPLIEDAKGRTVFEYAVIGKNRGLLNYLLSPEVVSNKQRQQALLHMVSQTNDLTTLDRLLLDNLDVNLTNDNGLTALHFCALTNSVDVMRRLLSGGNCIVDAAHKGGATPLHVAATHGHVTPIEYLLASKADIDRLDNEKCSALYKASEKGHLGAVKLLLKFKADLGLQSESGLTALQVALLNGHIKVALEIALVDTVSATKESIAKLPSQHKTQIEQILPIFERMLDKEKAAPRIGGLLVRHGIYRQEKEALVPQARASQAAAASAC